jgi:ribosomal protein L20
VSSRTLDPAYQRSCTPRRHELQPADGAIHKAGIEINRKTLADLAMNNNDAFKAIVEKVK